MDIIGITLFIGGGLLYIIFPILWIRLIAACIVLFGLFLLERGNHGRTQLYKK